jgi:hypothetical protein
MALYINCQWCCGDLRRASGLTNELVCVYCGRSVSLAGEHREDARLGIELGGASSHATVPYGLQGVRRQRLSDSV